MEGAPATEREGQVSWRHFFLVALFGGFCAQAMAAPGPATEDRNTGAVVVRASEGLNGKSVPIANVMVVGRYTGRVVDSTGTAIVGGLSSGQWIVRVQVIRRDPQSDTVSVTAGDTTVVNIAVEPLTAREHDCVLEIRPIRGLDWTRADVRPCDWRVTSARAATPRDVPFDQGVSMVGEPENPNVVPGPGTLRAVVRSLKEHHPNVLIEDTASGSSRLLLNQWASRPKWSPDGRWVACNAYGSMVAPYNLAIVEVTSGRVWQPHLGAQIGEYRWSPDSQRLALELVSVASGTVLGFFSLAAGTFAPVDTLTVLADYGFSWSPDSRMLAVSKPTFTDRNNEDEVTQADLLLIDVSGARCQLVQGKDFLAADPRWIDAMHLRYTRNVWKIDGSGASKSLMIALSRSK